jgi:hypothetical protein
MYDECEHNLIVKKMEKPVEKSSPLGSSTERLGRGRETAESAFRLIGMEAAAEGSVIVEERI